MLDLSKELKEDIALAQDWVSWLVDAISYSVVRFDHQFASSPSHSLAARACFFSGRCMACPQCRFPLYEETSDVTVCRYGWVDFWQRLLYYCGHRYIIVVFFTDIVFVDKWKCVFVCVWQRTRKFPPHCAQWKFQTGMIMNGLWLVICEVCTTEFELSFVFLWVSASQNNAVVSGFVH